MSPGVVVRGGAASERLQHAMDVIEHELERFVVSSKEKAARSVGKTAFSIACTARSQARAGSVSDNKQGRVGWVHARVQLNPRMVLGPRGCCGEGKYSL